MKILIIRKKRSATKKSDPIKQTRLKDVRQKHQQLIDQVFGGSVDTSDIPEADEAFFKRAKLKMKRIKNHDQAS